jgi:hypothetical protein
VFRLQEALAALVVAMEHGKGRITEALDVASISAILRPQRCPVVQALKLLHPKAFDSSI